MEKKLAIDASDHSKGHCLWSQNVKFMKYLSPPHSLYAYSSLPFKGHSASKQFAICPYLLLPLPKQRLSMSSGGRFPYSSCCCCPVGSNPETLWWNADCILSIATDMNDLTEPGLNAPIINCLVISCFSDFADKFLQQITLGTVWSGPWTCPFLAL